MNRPTCIVVLAAGEGTRMRSDRPKPLHVVGGRPLVYYVLDAIEIEGVLATVVVVGHQAAWVEKVLRERSSRIPTRFVEQFEQLGTGHAVSVALAAVSEVMGDDDGDVVIVPSDTPLLRRVTMAELVQRHRASDSAISVLTAHLADPTGYGRIVRARDGSIERIVEQRDATALEREITEVNTSIMVVRASLLGPALRRVDRRNAQREYYLTDVVAVLHDAGHLVQAVVLEDPAEATGVNDREQLAVAEAVMRGRINRGWLQRGVTIWDPSTTYVDADVELAPGASLLPGTVLRGRTVVETGASIGPNAHLVDSRVGQNARIGAVEADRSVIGAAASVGSYCVLGPGSQVAPGEVVAPGTHRPS